MMGKGLTVLTYFSNVAYDVVERRDWSSTSMARVAHSVWGKRIRLRGKREEGRGWGDGMF